MVMVFRAGAANCTEKYLMSLSFPFHHVPLTLHTKLFFFGPDEVCRLAIHVLGPIIIFVILHCLTHDTPSALPLHQFYSTNLYIHLGAPLSAG